MKRKLIFLTCFLFSLLMHLSADAATVTWSAAVDSNDLASDPDNWSGGMTPQNGDKVIFDGTSVKNCNWNLKVTLVSITIKADYTGKITKTMGTDVTVAKLKRWTGNASNNDESALNPANWSGNTLPQNGDRVVFDETSSRNCTWDININPAFVSMTGYSGTVTLNNPLTINGSLTVAGGALNLNDRALNVDGYLLIGINGTLNATSSIITVKGSWANYGGNFIAGTSTVILAGTNQTIYGSTTYYNLQKIVTTADTLYFEAGSTQTMLNSLTLQGIGGNLLALRSTVDGQYWYINPQGTRNISYIDITDCYNRNITNLILLPDSVDSGNNTGVSTGGSECVCIEDRRWAC